LEVTCDEVDIRSPCDVDTFDVTGEEGLEKKEMCKKYRKKMEGDKPQPRTLASYDEVGKRIVIKFVTSSDPAFHRQYAGFKCRIKCVDKEKEKEKHYKKGKSMYTSCPLS
jgi:hypothetical protein